MALQRLSCLEIASRFRLSPLDGNSHPQERRPSTDKANPGPRTQRHRHAHPQVVYIGQRLELRTRGLRVKARADQNQTLTRKPNYFEARFGFLFDNGRCMFCPGSGTKQAQPCV